MITVPEALDQIFALATPMPTERVALAQAAGRVLREDVIARRQQPPFAASAMDGYALRAAEVAQGSRFKIIGESAAGTRFSGAISTGETVRIFTGAPVPDGADMVVLQEDVVRDGDVITLSPDAGQSTNIRPAGADFALGSRLKAPRRLSPADVALIAAMNLPEVTVSRRPVVALIATGDELVPPGGEPGPDQIVASNTYGLKAMLEAQGADARILPIARDDLASLQVSFNLAAPADLIVTIGGASVGDHDLVAEAAEGAGLERRFWKVAMRPGKPLMAGRMGGSAMIGLPGNPVSSMVCGTIFAVPLVLAMLGLPATAAPRRKARLAVPLAGNGPREHYLRAAEGPNGITPFGKQDSSLLSILSEANCLAVQPPGDPPRNAGDEIEVIDLHA